MIRFKLFQAKPPLLQSAIGLSMASAAAFSAYYPSQAQAQATNAAAPAIRPEVVKSLQASQDALREGQIEKALTLAQQTMAMPNISKDEKPYILRTLAAAAMQAKNFGLAINTLETLVQELPDTTLPDQRLALIESILSASQQAQDLERFVKWARIYWTMKVATLQFDLYSFKPCLF
jgi:hypothetical protein